MKNLFSFLFLSLFISTFYAQQCKKVPNSQKNALIALYNATNGSNWANNTNWNTGARVCNWYGVTVVNGQVTQVNLGNNNLVGTLPTSLGNLTQLQSLQLHTNQLSGTIPSSLASLTSLTVLSFENNGYIFSDFENQHQTYLSNVASDYSYQPQAKVDQIQNFNLDSGGSITLTTSVLISANNTYQWYKDGVAINGANSKNYTINNATSADAGIYYLLANNSIVTGMTLQRNNITVTVNTTTCNVPQAERDALVALYNATNGANWTTTWNLSDPVCNWSGITVENDNVTRINLVNNNLTGFIPPEIGNLSQLTKILLDNNNLNGIIPFEIGNLTDLTDFWIQNNQVSGPIPNSIGNLTNLKYLFLNNNALSGQIPSELGFLTALEMLYLHTNNLEGNVPSAITTFPALIYFYIHQNALVFSNFENEHNYYLNNLSAYNYTPQDKVDELANLNVSEGNSITLSSTELTSNNNTYQWYKDGVEISGATSKDYVISNASPTDEAIYYFLANNSLVTGLTLQRHDITLSVSPNTCGVSQSERDALVALYNSTNGLNWTNTWNLSDPVCNWYGVTVTNGSVTGLDLGSNGLSGSLPNEIGNLTELSILDLAFNYNISGSIPSSITNLTKLTRLSFQFNQLSGPIPSDIGSLTNLQVMDLYVNKLTGSIPSSVGNLVNLDNLYLYDNNLTGTLPTELGDLTNLRNIIVTGNEFTGSLPPSLGNLTSLLRLGIQSTNISGNIPDEIWNMTSLIRLHLSNNQLTGNISPLISNLTNLQELYLDLNDFSGSLPSELSNLVNLEKLRLKANNFNGPIPNLILNSQLIELSFEDNNFFFRDFENQHSSYQTNIATYIYSPQEKVDTIETFNITENSEFTLTTSLDSQNNTYQWYKDGVAISGAISKDYTISSATTSDDGVYHVVVTNSIVTGLTLEREPITITVTPDACVVPTSQRDALMAFYHATDGPNWTNTLANDQPWDLSIPVCNWFGVTVVGGNVTRLQLVNNNLNGSIASELQNLSELEVIILHSDNLSGSIPQEIQNLTKLKRLDLKYNNLSGGIPSFLGSMLSLEVIALNGNMLGGTIPLGLGSLLNLDTLTLNDNGLEGSIPDDLGNLTNLRILDFQGNLLSGNIPESFGNLISINNISLNNNQLSGKVPSSIADLPLLGDFRINGNKFKFIDFESEHNAHLTLSRYLYKSQAKIDNIDTINVLESSDVTLTSSFESLNNSYQWYMHSNPIPGATNKDYTIMNVQPADAQIYSVRATNSIVSDLTIIRNNITINVNPNPCPIPSSERDALVAIYNTTDGPNWTNSWDLSTPVCDWYGVTVTNGTISGLDLIGNNLVGTIPDEIGTLLGLTSLKLSDNQLSGSIPSTIGDLTNLIALDLNQNLLTGQLPITIGNLTNLQSLKANWNLLSGPIPDEYSSLINLNTLNIYRNDLTGVIPAWLGTFGNLSILHLSDNEFTGTIPSELGNLTNLRELWLSTNLLSGPLPSTLGGLTQLKKLIVYDNQLTGQIPSSYAGLSSLEEILLAKNALDGGLPNWLGSLQNLRIISVSENQFTGDIPSELSNLTLLTTLSLYTNGFSGIIPQGIANLQNLSTLRFNDNNFTGQVPDFTGLINLIILNFERNNFVFNDFENQHSTYLNNITEYNNSPQNLVDQEDTINLVEGNDSTLSSTQLLSPNNSYQWYKDGVAISGATNKDYIISGATSADSGVYHVVASNSIVTNLTLERHPITVTVSQDACGVSQTERDALVALYNATDGPNWTNTWNLSGPVCNWYGVTVANGTVTKLELGTNNLGGTIPTVISNLPNLTHLNLGDNSITGPIPSELWNLTNLVDLNLSRNGLASPLPIEIGNLVNLTHLNLGYNDLQGPIPSEIGLLTQMTHLVLADANLNGEIPGSIGSMQNLFYLALGENNLSGPIPTEIGTLSNLGVLLLNTNELTGLVPDSFGGLSNLSILHLFTNQLSGLLPSSLENLTNLTQVYINNNQFSGDLPNLTGNLSLSQLLISSNKFVFSDFEVEHNTYQNNLTDYQFSPQDLVDIQEDIDVAEGSSIILSSNVLTSPNNTYQWYKDNQLIVGATSKDYTISNFQETDVGAYNFLAGNTVITELSLLRRNINLNLPTNICNVPDTERDALLIFYDATGGDSWNNTQANDRPWNINTPVCDWFGVTVENGTVTVLDLRSNGLTGSIPNTIDDLTNLTRLTLYSNELSGSIPDEIGNLSNLTTLLLYFNQLSGSIPTTIGDLLSLQNLQLSFNNLSGNIPQSLGNLFNLQTLNLNDNDLIGEIPNELENLVNLETLQLSTNELFGPIPQNFVNFPNLSTLTIAHNEFIFSDFESEHTFYANNLNLYSYSPQELVDFPETFSIQETDNITLKTYELISPNNNYQWYKDGVEITGATDRELTITNASSSDSGTYHFTATNDIVSGLTLTRFPITLQVAPTGTIDCTDKNPSNDALANLLNHLIDQLKLGISIPSVYNPTEMQALAPYLDVENPAIYNFQFREPILYQNTYQTYAIMTFSFSDNDCYQTIELEFDYCSTIFSPSSLKNIESVSISDNSDLYTINRTFHACIIFVDSIDGSYQCQDCYKPNRNLTNFIALGCASVCDTSQDIYFCTGNLGRDPKVSDLTPSGPTVNWYLEETSIEPLSDQYDLSEEADANGQLLWWDDTDDNVLTRSPVTVYVDAGTPDGPEDQTFSPAMNATVADLEVDGTNIQWYDTPNGGTPLSSTTLLSNGYYYAQNGSIESCRLWVQVFIEVPEPDVDGIQYLCDGSKLEHIVVTVLANHNYAIYTSPTGGSALTLSTPITDGKLYYVEQMDSSGNSSPTRSAVLVEIIEPSPPYVPFTTQEFYSNDEYTIGKLLAIGRNIRWYLQETSGDPLDPSFILVNGETYYAEQTTFSGCVSPRSSVTVVILEEELPTIISCEKFKPRPGESYVLSSWIKQQEVQAINSEEIYFNNSEASQRFADLLNHIKDRLLSDNPLDRHIPENYVPSSETENLNFDLIMPYVQGAEADEKTLIVYEFTTEKDDYGRIIGFSFSLNRSGTSSFTYLTPCYQSSFSGDCHRYPIINNQDIITLNFTDTSISNGTFNIHSTFKFEDANYYYNSSNIDGDSGSSGIKDFIVQSDYVEVPGYLKESYGETFIVLEYLDTSGAIMDNTTVTLFTTGNIIDGWQKIYGSFTIPSDAAKMHIKLSNASTTSVNSYFDDLRFHPVDSNMKTFVYNPDNQRLMSELDENNYSTFYEYDQEGGLIRVKKETERGVYTIQETRSHTIKTNIDE